MKTYKNVCTAKFLMSFCFLFYVRQKEEYIISIQREWQEKLKEQTATLTKEKAEVVNQLHVLQDELQSLHRFRTCQVNI